MNAFDACRHLAEEIGPRWIGSDGEKQAGDWIEEQFRSLGYETRRLWFDCPAWDYDRTALTVAGERVEAGAQMFSPACDVEAELVLVQPDGHGSFSGKVPGKLAVLKETDTGGVLNRSKLACALKAADALGAIVISRLPETWSTKIFRDPEAGLPCAAVSGREGPGLLKKLGSAAKLVIDAQPRPGKTSVVIGERSPPGAPVCIVGAHYDSAPYGPGATDNAAGVGVLLKLAERFSGTKTAMGLRFCAFGGHEFGGNDANGFGSKNYARRHADELQSVRLVLNLDGIGKKGSHPILSVYGGEDLLARVSEFASAREDVEVTRATGGGADIGAFREAGIECVWLRSSGGDDRAAAIYHSPLDDMRWVGQPAIQRIAQTGFEFLKKIVT